jgi:uncharacterized membrane protein
MPRPLQTPDVALVLDEAPRARRVSAERSATWLARGWADLLAHPGIGLTYGAVFAAVGWLLTVGLVSVGLGSLILPLAAGFMLVAPLAAVGLYEVSRRRERGEAVTFAAALSAVARNGEQIADFGLVLMLFFCAWFELAMLLFAAFFGGKPPELGHFMSQVVLSADGFPFMLTGTLIGGVLAALAFALSVATMPMLLDREVTVLAAMRTSLRAVWVNRLNMVGWAATLAVLGFIGMAALFIGLAVTLPVAAHASWHAYRDLVED